MTNILPLMVLKGLGCGDHTGEREREREREKPSSFFSPSHISLPLLVIQHILAFLVILSVRLILSQCTPSLIFKML